MGSDFQPLGVDWIFTTANDTSTLKNLLPVKQEAKASKLLLRNQEIADKEKELEQVRREHFSARKPADKRKYRDLDKKLRQEIADLLSKNHALEDETAQQLAGWDPYNQNAHADFFDPEWMFGIDGGFDVVIGNPPYDVLNVTEGHHISPEALENLRTNPIYQHALGGKLNLFRLFLAISFHLLKATGSVCYIIPYGFMCDSSSKRIRKYILETKRINAIEAFPERDDPNKRLFEAVKMSTCIVLIENSPSNDSFPVRTHYNRYISKEVPTINLNKALIYSFDSENAPIPLMTDNDVSIVRKMLSFGKRISNYGRCYEGEVNLTFHKKYLHTEANGYMKMAKGAAVQKWQILEKMSQGKIEYLDYLKWSKVVGPKSLHHQEIRIVMQGITGVNESTRLKLALLPKNVVCGNSANYIMLEKINCTRNCLGYLELKNS